MQIKVDPVSQSCKQFGVMANYTKKCHYCAGTGKEIDDKATGAALRAARIRAGIKQNYVAHVMGFTKSYVHDLECGDRHWTTDKIEAYTLAIA